MRKILFVLLCSLLTVQVFGYDFKDDGSGLCFNITSNTEPYTVEVTYDYSNNYSLSSVIIQETVSHGGKTYLVTSIGSGAFGWCSNLNSVTIPNSVLSIGSYAFINCTNLTSVSIPNSITSIDYEAFEGCIGLTSVIIPNSVTSIGEYAFYGCSGLIAVNFADNSKLTSIDYSTFRDCNSLTSVTIPNSVTSIGSGAFSGCTGLTLVTIPNSVTEIGTSAFEGCIGLTSVTIPNSVTSIGPQSFRNCSSLTSVTIPNSVTSIGEYAFYFVRNIVYNGTAKGAPWGALTMNGTIDGDFVYTDEAKTQLAAYIGHGGNVSIPNSVTSIGEYAFYYCEGLTSVTIPESVTTIGNYAFAYCHSLISVTIPNSVASIGEYAFYFCEDLTSLTIPESVTTIGNYAFAYCHSLISVTIPNSVASIGNFAFHKVKNIIYNGSNTNRSWGAFTMNGTIDGDFIYKDSKKTQLVAYIGQGGDVTIPNTVVAIGEEAFSGCTSMTSVTMPNSVKDIGSSAFSNCIGLISVTMPNSVTRIGNFVFGNCTGLTSVTIPESVASIGYEAFAYCSGLTSVTIPNSVTNIESYAFYDCTGLTFLNIPYSVTSIGYSAFKNVKEIIYSGTATYGDDEYWGALTMIDIVDGDYIYSDLEKTKIAKYIGYSSEVVIPNGVTEIGSSVFQNCTNLTSVTIPNSVTSIGDYAFQCINLKYVYFGSSVADIGHFSFAFCDSLQEIVCDNNPNFKFIDGVLYNKDQTELVFCYAGKKGDFTIPNTVKTICYGAFATCNGLTSVTIPCSVDSIAEYAFRFDDFIYSADSYYAKRSPISMISMKVEAEIPPITTKESFMTNTSQRAKYYLYVPCNSLELYLNSPEWNDYFSFKDHIIGYHNVVVDSAVCATNTSTGLTEGSHCSVCGQVIVAQQVLPMCSNKDTVVVNNVDTVYIIQRDTLYNIVKHMDTIFINSNDTIYSIINNYDTVYSTRIDTVYSVISHIDTVYSVVSKIDTIYNIIYTHDTVYNVIYQKDTIYSIVNNYDTVYSTRIDTVYSIISRIDTVYSVVSKIDTIYNIINIHDTVYNVIYQKDTIYSIVNNYDTVYSTRIDTVYSIISRIDTVYSVVSKIDTIYNIIYTHDTVYNVIYQKDTIYSIVNNYDTVYSTRIDTVYSIISRIDTVYSVVSKIDTIYNIINIHDTVYNVIYQKDTVYSIVNNYDTVYISNKKAKTYNVNVKSINNKMGFCIGSGKYESNEEIEIVAIPQYGYHFTKWSDGNTDNPRTVTVPSNNIKFTAEFEYNNYYLIASSNNIKMGYVEGSDDYAYLSKTELRAVPKYGYKFTGWSDGETVNPREVLVYCDTTFTALFMANDETDIDGETANGVVVYAHHNVIVVENATADIYVYDAMGRLVARRATCQSAEIAINRQGLYIVKVGDVAKRVSVLGN